jgi:hypothetical protein
VSLLFNLQFFLGFCFVAMFYSDDVLLLLLIPFTSLSLCSRGAKKKKKKMQKKKKTATSCNVTCCVRLAHRFALIFFVPTTLTNELCENFADKEDEKPTSADSGDEKVAAEPKGEEREKVVGPQEHRRCGGRQECACGAEWREEEEEKEES